MSRRANGSGREAHQTAAERVLGADHPLTLADRELRRAAAGVGLTALFVAVAAAAGYPGRAFVVMWSGVLVLFALLVRLALLADARRQRALDLVLAGDEALPIAAVARLRRSLLGRRRSVTVRRLHHELAVAVARPVLDRAPPTPPISSLLDDVTEIAVALESTHSARAVAMTAQLLEGGAGWHLLSSDREGLRRELGRIRFVLRAGAQPADGPPAAPVAVR